MRETNPKVLIEPSFADAIRAIESAEELPLQKRRHWSCSLRVIAEMLGRAPELVAARWTAVRVPVSRLHHALRGVGRKTLTHIRHSCEQVLSHWSDAEVEICRAAGP